MCFLTVTHVFVVWIRMVTHVLTKDPSHDRGEEQYLTYLMLFVLATRLKGNRKSRILMLVSKGESGSQRKKMPK